MIKINIKFDKSTLERIDKGKKLQWYEIEGGLIIYENGRPLTKNIKGEEIAIGEWLTVNVLSLQDAFWKSLEQKSDKCQFGELTEFEMTTKDKKTTFIEIDVAKKQVFREISFDTNEFGFTLGKLGLDLLEKLKELNAIVIENETLGKIKKQSEKLIKKFGGKQRN